MKEAVKERYAYLLNVYQNRGVYNEEFGNSFYTEDQEEGEEVEIMEEQDDEDAEEEVLDITKDEDGEKGSDAINSEDVVEIEEELDGKTEDGAELAEEEADDDEEEVDDALLDTPDSEPGEEDM